MEAYVASQSQYAPTSLYVADLEVNVTDSELYDLFDKLGQVISVRVCRDLSTRRSLGYGYVNYVNPQYAARAMEVLNYEILNGKAIRIMYSNRDPSVRKSGSGNIFIKNLDKAIDQKTLHDIFSRVGNILSCKIATDSTGQSKGYGFVQFEAEESAQEAIKKLNGMPLNDKQVYVGPFLSKQERDMAFDKTKLTNVFVKNFSASTTDDDLNKAFSEYGTITSAVVMRDAEGNSKCFGFVSFENADDAAKAIHGLNGQKFDEKKWYVGKAQKKNEREQERKQKFEQTMEAEDKSQGLNLYIKYLDDTLSDESLRELFAPFGTITSCKVMRDPNGTSRGFGFVAFSTPEDASRAIMELNRKKIGSKPLYVAVAQRKEDRRAWCQARFSDFSQMPTIAMAPIEAPMPTIAMALAEAPMPTITVAPTEASMPTIAMAPAVAPMPTIAMAPIEAPMPTIAMAPVEAPMPTIAMAPAEAPMPTIAMASAEAPMPTIAMSPVEAPQAQFSQMPTIAMAPAEAPIPTIAVTPAEALRMPMYPPGGPNFHHSAGEEAKAPKVCLYWDMNNAEVPRDISASVVTNRIRKALRRINNTEWDMVVNNAYGNVSMFTEEQMKELETSGITVINTSTKREAADKRIINDMQTGARRNPTAWIMLVTGDADYAFTLNDLSSFQHHIILVVPIAKLVPMALMGENRVVLGWRNVLEGLPSDHIEYHPCHFEVLHEVVRSDLDDFKRKLVNLVQNNEVGYLRLDRLIGEYKKLFGVDLDVTKFDSKIKKLGEFLAKKCNDVVKVVVEEIGVTKVKVLRLL